MRMLRTSLKKVRRFAADESGAVTVDWVALTAAVVVIGIGLTYAVFGTAESGIGGPVANPTPEQSQATTNIDGAVATALPDPAGGDGN